MYIYFVHSTNDCCFYKSFFSILKSLRCSNGFWFLLQIIYSEMMFLLSSSMNNLGVAAVVCQNTINALPLSFSLDFGRTGDFCKPNFLSLLNKLLSKLPKNLKIYSSSLEIKNVTKLRKKSHVFFINYFCSCELFCSKI